ncbi:MAG: hypothetical protein A2428_08755 [Bdellovibrionales bacterium RIFOXYC1_FULL_54_43]|nr:MAG: hypothetical protein A2428_08755 [Bdellovibrionales bacterium RIFOXYC1_FULL_54_43]
MITIRELNGNDFGGFLHLMQGFYQYAGEKDFDRTSIETLFRKLVDPASNFVCVAALTGTKMIGMCSLTFGESSYKAAPFAWADDLYVETAYRQQGIAGLLLQRVKQIACERNCSNILLGVGITEDHLQAFYKRNGFKEMPCKLFTLPLT